MRYLFGFLSVCALGLVPLVGCSETAGTGGSGGSAGTGGEGGSRLGACTNRDDLVIVCAQEFVDQAWNCGSRSLGCTPPTDDDAATFQCRADKASQCLQDDTGMSADCGDCFGAAIACVLANCESCVGRPNSQECLMCRAENCNDAMYECTGDIVAGCDGDVWCQRVDCDDLVDCTEDVCNPTDGICSNPPVADETPCAGGTCQSGACALTDSVLPCNEHGIRNAVAAGGGPYTFDCNGLTRVLTKAEIVIDKDVILDGGGNLMVDGDHHHRVFSIADEVTAELMGFVVTGGVATDGRGDFAEGGGIANHGTLTITDSALWENGSPEEPFGTRGAGVFNNGTLTLTNTELFSNVGGLGAGIWNDGVLMMTESTLSENSAEEGGGIHNGIGGTMSLTNTTVSGNRAVVGGGVFNEGTLMMTESPVWGNAADERGGGIFNEGTMTLANTEVSGNNAGGSGGGIDTTGTLTLTNSSVSWNAADLAGGIFNDGILMMIGSTVSWNEALVLGGIGNDRNGTLAVTNSTVSANHAEFIVRSIYNDGTLTLTNSTVSGNGEGSVSGIVNTGMLTVTNSLVNGDCDGIVTSNGYNIESPGNTCGFDQATDQVNVTEEQLNLGPLAENGGPTETHALENGSVAIDRIPESMCQVDEDQRGEPRPETGGSMCDVGSFEVQPQGRWQ